MWSVPTGDDESWRPAYNRLMSSEKAFDEARDAYTTQAETWREAQRLVNWQRNHGSPDFTWDDAFTLLGLGS